MRVTTENVRAALGRYERACRALGLLADADRLVLSEGSAPYGRAWWVNLQHDGSGAHYRPPAGDDYLGMTKREAFERLADRAAVLEDAARCVAVSMMAAVISADYREDVAIIADDAADVADDLRRLVDLIERDCPDESPRVMLVTARSLVLGVRARLAECTLISR